MALQHGPDIHPVFTKADLQAMKNQKEEKGCDEILFSIFKSAVHEVKILAKEGKTEYRFPVREPSNTGFEDPQYILDKYFEYAVATFPDSEVYIDRVIIPQEKTQCRCNNPPLQNTVCIVIDWS